MCLGLPAVKDWVESRFCGDLQREMRDGFLRGMIVLREMGLNLVPVAFYLSGSFKETFERY
jgi:hypothetical protein